MTPADVINAIQYLGLTPSNIFPLILLGAVICYVGYKFISPIKKSVSRITNACIEMQTLMGVDGTQLRHHLTEAPGSPLQPTQYGKKLIVESGLEKILDDQKGVLRAALSKLLPPTPTEYDIQEKSRELLISQKDEPIMGPVKQYAYQNGLNIEVILNTGGLWLRDDYLNQARLVKSE